MSGERRDHSREGQGIREGEGGSEGRKRRGRDGGKGERKGGNWGKRGRKTVGRKIRRAMGKKKGTGKEAKGYGIIECKDFTCNKLMLGVHACSFTFLIS